MIPLQLSASSRRFFNAHPSAIILAVAASLSVSACLEQYDPTPARELFQLERRNAQRPIPLLTATGEIPAPKEEQEGGGVDTAAGQYLSYCASCHGADGRAASATAQAMNPKPRSFVDEQWQASVDDAYIAQVIKEGGAAVGLSSAMAPWGAVLNEDQIAAMVAHVRAFAQAHDQEEAAPSEGSSGNAGDKEEEEGEDKGG